MLIKRTSILYLLLIYVASTCVVVMITCTPTPKASISPFTLDRSSTLSTAMYTELTILS